MALNGGKTLCVFGVKGGIGKSVLTLNLAGAASNSKIKTLIIDMDIYGGSIAFSLNKEVKRTISDGEILKSSNTGTVKKTTTKKVASKTKNEDSDKSLKDAKATNGEVKKATKKATSKTGASKSEMIKSKSTTTKKVEGDTPSKVTKKTTSKVTSKK